MLLDDDGWPIDEDYVMTVELDGLTIIREPGTEFREGEFLPINRFGLFGSHGLICGGTFEYVTNYYWREFA